MDARNASRRDLLKVAGLGTAAAFVPGIRGRADERQDRRYVDKDFFIRPEELRLGFHHTGAERRLSYGNFEGSLDSWRKACRTKLAELIGFAAPTPCPAELMRSITHEGVRIEAWIMRINEQLSIPAYLVSQNRVNRCDRAVMAIHGHGEAEACVGKYEDYHHRFALKLAQAGHVVLCPALRGFGALGDMAFGDDRYCLDYWKSRRSRQFTLISDAFLYGQTVIGQTIEDLLRWEMWLAARYEVKAIDVAGISYGGDLAVTYPVFSSKVGKIYASGTLGSFEGIFSRCYNAPAHGIPGILKWMDRSDIAGLNAPRLLRLHYGQLDTPGPRNNSASHNETVQPALAELRGIYKAHGAESQVTMYVTPNSGHEMDIKDLSAFLAR